jgi:transposase-like protein
VDEIYFRAQGRSCYLYRTIDSACATIDFLFSALRDADVAKRLFRNPLSDLSQPQTLVINTDLAPIHGSAIRDIKKEEMLRTRCRTDLSSIYNIFDQDHRAIKRRLNTNQGFRESEAANSRLRDERFRAMRR